MRESGIELFQYISARDKDKGQNIALFTPKSFQNKAPAQMITWLCQTSINEVGFMAKKNNKEPPILKNISGLIMPCLPLQPN